MALLKDWPLTTLHTRSLWHNRDYLLLWSGQAISLIGTQVSQLALPLLVLAFTHAPAQAGIVGALKALPYLVVSLPAGALMDRWNRKRVMMLCDSGRALALGSIALALVLGKLTMLQVYLVALSEGTLFVFFNLAEVSCLPRIVASAQLPTAVARNEATINLGYLLGPSLGGLLYGLGRIAPFLVDALSYLASVLSLCFIRTPFQEARVVSSARLWDDIQEGLAWLLRQPFIRFLALLTAIGNLVDFGVGLTVIVLAQKQHASAVGIGLMMACGGIGGIIGSTLASVVQRKHTLRQILVGTHWGWGLLLICIALAPSPWVIGILLGLIEVLVSIALVAQYSYRLATIPDALRARVTSVFRLVVVAGQPLGLTLAGVLIQAIHPVPTMLFLAAIAVALAGVTMRSPQLQQAVSAGHPAA
jgi:MFS family permease